MLLLEELPIGFVILGEGDGSGTGLAFIQLSGGLLPSLFIAGLRFRLSFL